MPPPSDPPLAAPFARARERCPKRMAHGPCGGVAPGGACEVDARLPCPYLEVLEHAPWRRPRLGPDAVPPEPAPNPAPNLASEPGAGRLERTLAAGGFALVAEAYTPDSADLAPLVAHYAALGERVTAVNIAEHALASPHASTLAAAALLERAGVETIVNLTCRDRNLVALQGEILGAAALGVRNLFCVTGDHPARGDHPGARAVYDLDGIGLLRLARRLRDEGTLASGRALATPPRLFLGAAANPFSPPEALRAERTAAKVAAGARFIQTQAIFDLGAVARFAADLTALGALPRARLIVGVALVTSLEQAQWLQREVPGARVPDALVRSLARTPRGARRAAGLERAAERVAHLAATPGVSGALLFPLLGDTDALAEVLDRIPAAVTRPPTRRRP